MRHSPNILHGFNSQGGDLDARVRFEQQRSAFQGEVASAKQRYLKKVGALERQLEQARSEKRDL